jgi:hypothetical protein
VAQILKLPLLRARVTSLVPEHALPSPFDTPSYTLPDTPSRSSAFLPSPPTTYRASPANKITTSGNSARQLRAPHMRHVVFLAIY